MDLNLWRKTKKERGMTYKDISQRSGLPVGTIKNIFAGYTPDPRESTIRAIELALGVETHMIHVYHTEKSPTVELTAEEKELLDNYRQLPKDLKHRAETYMEKLVEVLNEEDVRPISAPSNPSSQTPRSTLRITRRR